MSVLFSQPLTLRTDIAPPAHFLPLGNERGLSYAFGQKYPRFLSEYALRSHLALTLLRRRPAHDAIVTGRYGEFFAACQGLCPVGRRPHLLLDVEWPYRHASGWRRALSRALHRCIARGAWRIQVFCHAEAEHYSDYYGIAREKFVWLPYCTDLAPETYPARDGDYIFSGGRQNRDYATLAAAVRGLPMRVRIAAPPENLPSACRAGNIDLLGCLKTDDFLRELAGARLVVLSLEDGLLRCPGVITYVSAMRLGKCIIVNEPRGAASYLTDGQTGVLVPPRDPQALATAIEKLWHDHERRQWLADNARCHALTHFGTARYLADLERLCAAALNPEAP
ncbi:MAG: glycosyltransferase family 4 protein [Planctomycetia bacterium]|nr:glycosyltransferase family 4 protein [Planctomycetia bacterium]